MASVYWISEALRIFMRSLKVKRKGIYRYSGNANQICSNIVKDCWNGNYFQTSCGHFNEFYMRDFGWCVDSLLKLGYNTEVIKTLEYALGIYLKHGLKTTITPSGKAVDIFNYAPDSLAFLIRSLRAAKAQYLVEKYKDFLEKEVKKYWDIVIDKDTGLVRKDRFFSSIKDQAKRHSSCYDNCMTAMLSAELDKLHINNPFRKFDYPALIKKHFWTGKYFLDDLSGKNYIAADANIFPFYCKVFSNREMQKKSFSSIISEGLDMPFPLRYTKGYTLRNFVSLITENYEGDSIWAHMGLIYAHILSLYLHKESVEIKRKYTYVIEKYRNFLEVFNPDGTIFKTQFYYSDEGMLWAANYLTL